ncbi:MAG: hypothetical protein AB1413_10565 [Thermodesulfobacteriota bacterium]
MEQVRKRERLSEVLVTDGIGNDILKGAAVATGALGVGVLGAWALSSMVAAVIEAGGPLTLARYWLSAVTGS